MLKRTKIEIYAYSNHGTVKDFLDFIGITRMTFWRWVLKRAKPSVKHAKSIEILTKGAITEEYLRNRMD